MRLPVNAFCIGCGHRILAGEPVIMDINISASWVSIMYRHPRCANSPAIMEHEAMPLTERQGYIPRDPSSLGGGD